MVVARYIAVVTFTLVLVLFLGHRHHEDVRHFVNEKYLKHAPAKAAFTNPCPSALKGHIDILRKEYARLLHGIKYAAVVGFPDHSNKGDSAIWAGEMILLEYLGIKVIHAFRQQEDYDQAKMRSEMEKVPKNETVIMFHGGGNFGDLYHWHQTMREQVVQEFKDYPIRSFPQSYFYKDPANVVQTQQAYASHPDLQLTARDTKSFVAMHRDFGDKHEVILTPDAATMLFGKIVQVDTKPDVTFFLHARVDRESDQDHRDNPEFEDLRNLEDGSGKVQPTSYRHDDWLGKEPEGLNEVHDFDQRAWMRIKHAKEFLSQGELLITDRLHAHILTTLWDMPHVVVEEGGYQKARSYHETWLEGSCDFNSRFTSSSREAVEEAKTWFRNGRKFENFEHEELQMHREDEFINDVEDSD